MVEHTDSIDWPNGEGFTPCSDEYRKLFDEKLAIFDPAGDGDLEELEPEKYNAYCRLENDLANLQASGHLGKGERW